MKISEKQLQALFQIAIDSLRVNVVGNYFQYDSKTRASLVNDIIDQQNTKLVDIDDDKKPTLEPQFYKEDKKAEAPKRNYLQESIDILRAWRRGESGGATQFLLSTRTIKFLDDYDKAVTL
jgi:hypothetical protein